MTDSNTQIEALKRIRENNVHRKYIEYIRYTMFRNLEDNSKITFDFPITFLVGKNGGGKSSTLQSLYGCPQGYSLGDYWFYKSENKILLFPCSKKLNTKAI